MSPAHSPGVRRAGAQQLAAQRRPAHPRGLLKHELRRCGSLVIDCADRHCVPAGQALAVERFAFARAITRRLALHPRIRIERPGSTSCPTGPAILCTGPLIEGVLGDMIWPELDGDRVYFYDAIAPVVAADSIDWDPRSAARSGAAAPSPPGHPARRAR